MRNITTDFKNAAIADVVYPRWFAEMEFDSGTLRLWTGTGEISWNGEDWTGAGSLLNISLPEETQDLTAGSLTGTLVNVPDIRSLALNQDFSGRPVRVWLALLNADHTVISDPVQAFSGKMDTMPVNMDPQKPVIQLTAESDLALLSKASLRRCTHEDQQLDYPGDMFFEFVDQMQDRSIPWGTD